MKSLLQSIVPFATKFLKEKINLKSTNQLSTGKGSILVDFAAKYTVKDITFEHTLN